MHSHTTTETTTEPTFDFVLGTEKNDSFVFSQLPASQLSVLASSARGDVVFLLEGNDLSIDDEGSRNYFGFSGNDTIFGGMGDDFLAGNVGLDILYGNQGNDTIYGGQTEDSLYGGAGNDILIGDLGNDVLFGDKGNDTLTGSGGNDTLTGGDGSDVFTLGTSQGLDQIKDFQDGIDKLQLPTTTSTLNDLKITTNTAGQVVISLASNNQQLALLDGIAATDLTAADFVVPSTSETDETEDHDHSGHDHTQEEDPYGEHSFYEYEAFLSPGQEPGGEIDSDAKGYGKLSFAKNLSFGEVDVDIQNIDPSEIVGFHLHCGPPGFLGPIVVNFGDYGDFKNTIVDGQFSATIKNENITLVDSLPPIIDGDGSISLPKLPEGCPVDINLPTQQVNTVAGIDALARKGVLYFNVHTQDHSFYGEMRGQVYPAEE